MDFNNLFHILSQDIYEKYIVLSLKCNNILNIKKTCKKWKYHTNFDFKYMEYLNCTNSKFYKFNNLYINNNLKILNLINCSCLKKIPKLNSLMKLNCSKCINLLNIPKCLTNLRWLSIKQCVKIYKLPNTLENLLYLNCNKTKISKIPYNLINLEKIKIKNSNIKYIPETLINLKKIYCEDCDIELPKTCEKIKEIKGLNVNIDIPDKYTNLRKLHFSNKFTNKNKITIPNSFNRITSLKIQNIKDDIKISSSFVNLKKIMCYNCNITHIPSTLINLEKLNMYSTKINFIPSQFKNLIELNISKTLIDDIPNNLTSLEKLNIKECKYINKISNRFINLRKLICSETLIKKISKKYINLEKLECISCFELIYIPNNFNKLKFINCKGCRNLINMPSNYIKLQKQKWEFGRDEYISFDNIYIECAEKGINVEFRDVLILHDIYKHQKLIKNYDNILLDLLNKKEILINFLFKKKDEDIISCVRMDHKKEQFYWNLFAVIKLVKKINKIKKKHINCLNNLDEREQNCIERIEYIIKYILLNSNIEFNDEEITNLINIFKKQI